MNTHVSVRPEQLLRSGALKLLGDVQRHYYGEPFSLSGLKKRFGNAHGSAEEVLVKVGWLMNHKLAERGLSQIYSLTRDGRAFSSRETDELNSPYYAFTPSPEKPAPKEEIPDPRRRRR